MLLLVGYLSLPAIIGITIGMLAGITLHEFSHAYVADQLGDHRVRALGRVSLNPLRHLDPLGTLLLATIGMGWGKPVPVVQASLRSGRTGMAVVAVAGPLTNLLVAIGFSVVLRLLGVIGLAGPTVDELLYWAVVVNVLLAILNLLPIPPLDGSALLYAVLPPRWEYTVRRYQAVWLVVLIVLLVVPSSPLHAILALAYPWALALTGLPAVP